jgi:hypothetical protein
MVAAAPVLSKGTLLEDSALLVVIAEIELAGNNIILYSNNHRFKEFECARMRFEFECARRQPYRGG